MDKASFVQQLYEAGLAAGLTDAAARVMAAQGAIESSYGKDAPGNNFFGITKGADWTGETITRNDHDASGKVVQRQFRAYATPEEGIADRVALMDAKFPGFNDAKTVSEALAALRNGKLGAYYEAPQRDYEAAVKGINSKYLPQTSAAAEAIETAAPRSGSATDYLGALQYGNPGGGVGVNADRLDPEFARRLSSLIQAAEKATGDTSVKVFEGYRDPARSAQLRADYTGSPVKYDGKTYQPTPGMKGKYQAASPGVSQHNFGMAVDIRAGKNPDKYPSGPAYDWMVAHAAEFGLQNLGASDPAHFQIPQSEFKVAKSGTPLQPFKIYNPDGLVPPADIPNASTAVASKLDVAPAAPVPMPGRPVALGRSVAPQPAPSPAFRNTLGPVNDFNPLPAPAPLTPESMPKPAPTLGSRLPQDATFGLQDRLTPGRVTLPPTDFTTADTGAPADDRLLSLGKPANQNLVALGSARAAQPVATTKTITNPAYVEWEKTYGAGGVNKTLGDIHDRRDDATMKAQQSAPKAPPKTITVSIAPKTLSGQPTAAVGGFGGMLGNIGSGLQALGANVKTGVQSLGSKAAEAAGDLGAKATDAVEAMIPEMLRTVQGRTALIEPMIQRVFTPTPGQTGNPTRYGATPEERQAAAARRQALSEGRAVPAQTAVATSRSISPTITAAPASKSSGQPASMSSGSSSKGSGGSSGQQTITGSSTGRQYVVGQTYSNGNGTYVAQANGTFKKVA